MDCRNGRPYPHTLWAGHAAGVAGGAEAEKEFAGAFQAATEGHAQALILMQCPLFTAHHARLAALASRLPTMAGNVGYAHAGGLMHYGPPSPRELASCGHVRGQAAERGETGGSAGRAAHEIRADPQPQDRSGAGADDPPTLLILADEVIR